VILQFAAGKAGLVLVNINPAYQAAELKYCLNKVIPYQHSTASTLYYLTSTIPLHKIIPYQHSAFK
jgi:fatty-acyl-CoA synthase